MGTQNEELLLLKQEADDESCLYPFVCGLCGYRFNRINEFIRHFEMHSDMVTSEYFHCCQADTDELDLNQHHDISSTKYYSCGVCLQEFATLCLLHEHFCQKYDGGLYIVDAEKRKGIPKGRKCVGTVYSGAMSMPEDGEIVKTEIEYSQEDDGDEDMEYEEISDNEDHVNGEATILIDEETENAGENGIAIQKITVNIAGRTETYDVNINEECDGVKTDIAPKEAKKSKMADACMQTTESEADEDMSDLEIEEESSKKTKSRTNDKASMSTEEDLFDSYIRSEDLKSRRRSSIAVPKHQVKDLMAKAVFVNETDLNPRVYCPVCSKIVLKSYLQQHFKKAHSDEEYPCLICKKIFSNKGYLKDHIRFFHDGIKKSRGDTPNSKLGRHTSGETQAILQKAKVVGEEDGNNTKVECPVCEKILLRHYLPKHHQKLHSDKQYPCDQCDKVFQYNGYLADHKRYVHQGKRKKSSLTKYAKDPAIAALCDSAQTVDRKVGEKIKVRCPKCPKNIQREYLAKHLRTAHSDMEYPCDICEKKFSCQRFLYEHQKYVHMEKNTECEVCGKMFKGKAAKEKHKRLVHSETKRYKCEHCHVAFRTTFELRRHMTVHKDAVVYCFQCTKCEARFKTSKTLSSHERSVHRRAGRLQCKWPGCNRILNDRATFRKHYCIHTGERPFKCPLCERAFIQRVALKYHLKTKHNREDKMPPSKRSYWDRRRPEIKVEQSEAVPLFLDDQVEAVETDLSEMVQHVVDGQQVISDPSIVSDLIEMAQSSEGGVVPEALQQVLNSNDGENRTIVIYYQ